MTNLSPILSKSLNDGSGEFIEIDQAGNPISRPETGAPDGSSPIIPGAHSPTDPIVTTPVQTDSPLDECDGELKTIDWYHTNALSEAPPRSFIGQSADVIYVDRGNIRRVGQVLGNSERIDLNSQYIQNVYGTSADNICLRARNIGSVSGGSAGVISIINNFSSEVEGVGRVLLVQGNSAKKIRIFNMAVSRIEGGSGALHIQGGHVSLIQGQSGDIFLDHVTIDAVINSSARIHLRNGAQVLNQ